MFSYLPGRCDARWPAATNSPSRRLLLGSIALVGLALAGGCAVSQPTSTPTTTATTPTTTTTTTTVPARAPPLAPPATAPPGTLPDPARTPGGALPGVTTAEMCQAGWATSHRDVPETERLAAFAAYGVPYAERGGYELDHLIPLELGGDNTLANLWPQPHDRAGFPGSQTKDVVENRLHDLVCAGRLDLATAQHIIATDWQAALGLPTN